jgi:hypothetical protein
MTEASEVKRSKRHSPRRIQPVAMLLLFGSRAVIKRGDSSSLVRHPPRTVRATCEPPGINQLRIACLGNPVYIGIKVDLLIVLPKNGRRQEQKYRDICNYARKKFHSEFSLCVYDPAGPEKFQPPARLPIASVSLRERAITRNTETQSLFKACALNPRASQNPRSPHQ